MVWKPFPLSYLFPNATQLYKPSQVGTAEGQQGQPASYDYIVVGSGTAGSVIASRLSEARKAGENSSVLVLEAGEQVNDMISTIPLFSILRSNDETYSYKIKSEAQAGLAGKQVEVLAGRLVGGSSAINAGIYTRGTNRELDEWESLRGCQGWNHAALERYFDLPIRHDSHNSPGKSDSAPARRGPWQYSLRRNHLYPLTEKVLAILDEKGVKRNDEDPYNDETGKGPLGTGSFVLQSSISLTGRKVHAGNAYMSDSVLAARSNLKLCTRAKVTKIDLVDDGSGTATARGVFFQDDKGARFYARAKGKLIVCAGVMHTPHLLLLSGVGPRDELQRLAIDTVVDSPGVGKNMQDHLGVPLHFLVPYASSSICVSDGLNALPRFLQNVYDYFVRSGQGLFATPGFMEASAWLHTSDINVEVDAEGRRQLRLVCKDPHASICNIELLFSTYWLEWAQTRFKGLDEGGRTNPRGIMGIYVILTQPTSRGSITLASSDPSDPPKVDFNYLCDGNGEDLKTLRLGVKFALDVVMSLFQRGFDISPANVPGWDNKRGEYEGLAAQHTHPGSPFVDPNQIPDKMYDDFIRSHANPIYHGAASCQMGPPGTPLDPITNIVRGTSNLHVFDASAFPNVPSTHPQSLVFAGAEKVAEQLVAGK